VFGERNREVAVVTKALGKDIVFERVAGEKFIGRLRSPERDLSLVIGAVLKGVLSAELSEGVCNQLMSPLSFMESQQASELKGSPQVDAAIAIMAVSLYRVGKSTNCIPEVFAFSVAAKLVLQQG